MKPGVLDDEMYQLPHMGEIEKFNAKCDVSVEYDLGGTDLSCIDIRGSIADNINFEDACFGMTDLHDIDFRNAKMEGSSFAGANILGAF